MKFKVCVYLLLGSLLSGCVAVVVAGAAGLVVYDRRSMATIESDARIYHSIHKNLAKDPRFSGSHIEVISFNHVVLLVGQTPVETLRLEAERIAHTTPGVRRVYNELNIAYPSSMSTRTKDSLVTAQIRTRMLNKKGLESGSIRIVTENGVVYLMGIATPEQATRAVEVAREIRDVRKVVKVFQYIT